MPSAVEEMARHTRPLQMVPRIVKENMQFDGQDLKKGQTLLILLASANHNPDVFTGPARFDIGRTPNQHIAFGYGIHNCLGAPLARVEVLIALREFLQRYPNVQLSSKPLDCLLTLRNATLKELPLMLQPTCLLGEHLFLFTKGMFIDYYTQCPLYA